MSATIVMGQKIIHRIAEDYGKNSRQPEDEDLNVEHLLGPNDDTIPEKAKMWRRVIREFGNNGREDDRTGTEEQVRSEGPVTKKARRENEVRVSARENCALVLLVSLKGNKAVDEVTNSYAGDVEAVRKLELELGQAGTGTLKGLRVYFLCIYDDEKTKQSERSSHARVAIRQINRTCTRIKLHK